MKYLLPLLVLCACEPSRQCQGTDVVEIVEQPGSCWTRSTGDGTFYTTCDPPSKYKRCHAVMQRFTTRDITVVTVPRLRERN